MRRNTYPPWQRLRRERESSNYERSRYSKCLTEISFLIEENGKRKVFSRALFEGDIGADDNSNAVKATALRTRFSIQSTEYMYLSTRKFAVAYRSLIFYIT